MQLSKAWPLWLHAPHRRLLAANLACEVTSSDRQLCEADLALARGFIDGIDEVLGNLRSLVESCGSVTLALEEGVPLSLNHARLLGAAMCRLPSHLRVTLLTALLDTVAVGIDRVARNETAKQLLSAHAECSGFLARTVSLCASLAVILTCGHSLPEALLKLVGTSSVSLSPPTSPSDQGMLRAEVAFVSLFDSSENSELSASDLTASTMAKAQSEKLQLILEKALELSFGSATRDHCYLLFASWTNLGKNELWLATRSVPGVNPYSGVVSEDIPGLLVQLRDDMCYVHRLIQKAGRASLAAPFLRVIDQKDQVNKAAGKKQLAATVKRELRAMVLKATSLCRDVLSTFVPEDPDMNQEIPCEVFALLEALCVYISFAISSFTKPDVDFFSYVRSKMTDMRSARRSRGYSSESDYPSEAESNDSRDVVAEALDRLQNVCSAFGAVPAHPDWLDSECQAWEGVTFQEASEVASLAIGALTRLASVSLARARSCSCQALSNAKGMNPEIATLAADLVRLRNFDISLPNQVRGTATPTDDALSSPDENDLMADIAAVCAIDPSIAKVWMGRSLEHTREAEKRFWMRCSNQRIIGGLCAQHVIRDEVVSDLESPELRATGEWELLVVAALTSVGIHTPLMTQAAEAGLDYAIMDQAEMWEGVYRAALDSIAPAAALQRFALAEGGRREHPLKQVDSSFEDFDPLLLDCQHESKTSASGAVKDTVTKALVLVAKDMNANDLVCDAIASSLVVDPMAFVLLQGVVVTRFVLSTLSRLCDALDTKAKETEIAGALSSIVQALGAVLTRHSGTEDTSGAVCLVPFLNAALGEGHQTIQTVASSEAEVGELVCAVGERDDIGEVYHGSLLSGAVSVIWNDCNYVNRPTRFLFLRTLCALIDCQVRAGSVVGLKDVVKAFNEAPEERLRELVETDIFSLSEPDCTDQLVAPLLCFLFAHLLGPSEEQLAFKRPEIVLRMLQDGMAKLVDKPQSAGKAVLNVLFLYACRTLALEVVTTPFFAGMANSSMKVSVQEGICCLSSFLGELQTGLSGSSSDSGLRESAGCSLQETRAGICSHKEKSGFVDQHWYNCYTCGLVGDKGCCTLCALVCHEGHDVAYSRFSAFFCDCGAEGGRLLELGKSPSCKCLDPLQPQDLKAAFARGSSIGFDAKEVSCPWAGDDVLDTLTCLRIALSSFPDAARKALDGFIHHGRTNRWTDALFGYVRTSFQSYQVHQRASEGQDLFANCPASYDALRRSLSDRMSAIDAVKSMSSESFCPFAGFRPGSFQVKVSSDASVDSLKRAMLSTSGATRAILSADSRGHVLIAECNSLVFCAGVPLLAPHEANPCFFSRSSMGILFVKSLDFNIVGACVCATADRQIVAWGTHEACVCFLGESWTGCDRQVEFELGLGSLESGSEFVVKAGWLPGCSSLVYVASLRSLMVFDVSADGEKLSPIETVKLGVGNDSSLRGVVVTCVDHATCDFWMTHVLMENGHLHSFSLVRSGHGSLKATGVNFDPKLSLKLPISGSSDNAAFSLTLGEGIHLSYLQQARLLLYQTLAESVLALQVNEDGAIEGSFTLLPNRMSLGPGGDDGSIDVSGPYTHWTELGAVEHDANCFFRVACIGKRSSKEPSLLCVEFNAKETKVHELPWLDEPNSVFSSSPSVEGLFALSLPLSVARERSVVSLSGDPSFSERIVLGAALSNGSLHLYKELTSSTLRSACDTATAKPSWPHGFGADPGSGRKIPLLTFEDLKNVTEDDTVSYSSVGLGTYVSLSLSLSTICVDQSDSFSAPTRYARSYTKITMSF